MAELKKSTQTGQGNVATGRTQAGDRNRGEEFGTSSPATRGTDRDLDRSGESANQGHGHPREERGDRST